MTETIKLTETPGIEPDNVLVFKIHGNLPTDIDEEIRQGTARINLRLTNNFPKSKIHTGDAGFVVFFLGEKRASVYGLVFDGLGPREWATYCRRADVDLERFSGIPGSTPQTLRTDAIVSHALLRKVADLPRIINNREVDSWLLKTPEFLPCHEFLGKYEILLQIRERLISPLEELASSQLAPLVPAGGRRPEWFRGLYAVFYTTVDLETGENKSAIIADSADTKAWCLDPQDKSRRIRVNSDLNAPADRIRFQVGLELKDVYYIKLGQTPSGIPASYGPLYDTLSGFPQDERIPPEDSFNGLVIENTPEIIFETDGYEPYRQTGKLEDDATRLHVRFPTIF